MIYSRYITDRPGWRKKREADANTLDIQDPDFTVGDDKIMNLKFDISLDLNQLLNETQIQNDDFSITVIWYLKNL